MKPLPLLLVAVAGVALGVLIGWGALPPRETRSPDVDRTAEEEGPAPSARAEGDAVPEAAGSGVGLRGDPNARIRELEAEATRLKRRVAELETAEASLNGSKTGLTKPQPGTFRFGVPESGPRFDAADWPGLGGHIRAMTDGLASIPGDIAKGGTPSAASTSAIRAHNEPLASFALSVAGELKGTGGNGAFTHPAVLANLIRAILAEAGDPLTPAQEASIAPLGEVAARDLARPADPGAVALAATVHEVEVKQRFLVATRELLTPGQQALLWRPETEGRLQLDLLSPGLILFTIRDDVTAATPEEVETKLVKTVFDYAGIEIPDLEPWRWVGHDWLEATPGAKTPIAPRSPDAMFPKVEVVLAAARAELVAIERILSRGSWSDDQAKSLRGIRGVIQPQVVTSP